jgi:Putative lumazine-binding
MFRRWRPGSLRPRAESLAPDHVDAIELAGDNTALARVRCSIGSRDFVDFLTLVRTDGTWRIIAKVFQIIERGS